MVEEEKKATTTKAGAMSPALSRYCGSKTTTTTSSQDSFNLSFFLVTTPKNIWFDHVLELDLRWDDEHLEACLATSDHVELIIRQLQGLVNPHLGQDDQN